MFYELLIASMCASNPGTYQQACNKAAQATAMTVGVNKAEDQFSSYAQKTGKEWTGDGVWNVGGFVVGAAAKGIKDKELTYKVSTKKANILGIDHISTDAKFKPDNKGGSLMFGWSW